MKKHLILFVLILFGMVSAYSQGFGYHYSAGRENVQMQTPIAVAGADRPEDIWAVSGNMQPFGTCANSTNTPPSSPSYAGRRFGPPIAKPGDEGPNPSLLPIGDMDWVCWVLLGGYLIGVTVRNRRRAKQANTLCDNKA